MTGKHYNWHKRWTVDLDACTATHDSGLVVQVVRAEDDDAMDYLADNLDAWQAEMLKTMPISNLIPHAQRLLKEAVEVYQRALTRRH